jgi:hypothetical protein
MEQRDRRMRADGYAGAWLRTGDLDSHTNTRGRAAPLVDLQNADATDVFGEAGCSSPSIWRSSAGAT